MYISPRPALVTFTVDGVSVVVDSADAKILLNKHPTGIIKRYRKRSTSKKVGHGPVRSVPLSEYNHDAQRV